MKNRMIAAIMCVALLFSAVSCGNTSKANASASQAAPAAEEKAAEAEASPEAEVQEAVQETDAAVQEVPAFEETEMEETPAEEIAQADVSESTVENTDSDADSEVYAMQYAFANIKIDDQGQFLVFPNGTVGEDTVLYNDKTLGVLCDYIDKNVLEEGRTINRNFLYDLVSVQIIDPKMISSYDRFNNLMMFCLTVANEFYSMDVRVTDDIVNNAEPAKQIFEVVVAGKEDSWILDGHEMKFYLNGGNTEYTSSMFDAQTLTVWSLVLDQYYEETVGESQQQ